MPRQPASVILLKPAKFGRLLADVLRLARPESGVGYSLREACTKTLLSELGPDDKGLSAPAIMAILDGRRSRISALTLMRLMRLAQSVKANSDRASERDDRQSTKRADLSAEFKEAALALDFATSNLRAFHFPPQHARARVVAARHRLEALYGETSATSLRRADYLAAHLGLAEALLAFFRAVQTETVLPSTEGVESAQRRKPAKKK